MTCAVPGGQALPDMSQGSPVLPVVQRKPAAEAACGSAGYHGSTMGLPNHTILCLVQRWGRCKATIAIKRQLWSRQSSTHRHSFVRCTSSMVHLPNCTCCTAGTLGPRGHLCRPDWRHALLNVARPVRHKQPASICIKMSARNFVAEEICQSPPVRGEVTVACLQPRVGAIRQLGAASQHTGG